MAQIRRAIGLMSGTSLDGIDVGVLETDGDSVIKRVAQLSVAYDPDFRARLRLALDAAAGLDERTARPAPLADIERELTERHALAVQRLLDAEGWSATEIDLIGFHGQTVLHRPEAGLTVQLGDGPLLRELTGITTVYDMRARDVAGGGQGAPLAPVYHQAMAARLPERPVAVVNIGGVANVTWIGSGGELLAFDTGPGNAPLDDWMLCHAGTARDDDGRAGAQGTISEDLVIDFLCHPYFAQLPPKSLDRDSFSFESLAGLSLADGAATLTACTVRAIAKSCEHFPAEPALWIVCGGGRRNRTMMGMLAGEVENAVAPAEAVGFDGDMIEAEAWAYLAVRCVDGRAITFPGTTGVHQPTSGGVLVA